MKGKDKTRLKTNDSRDEPLCSPFIISGRLLLALDFPSTGHCYYSKDAGDWSKPGTHESVLIPRGSQRADIARSGEHMHCHAALKWNNGSILAPVWYIASNSPP